MAGLCGWAILDELEHMVTKHDFSGCRGNIFTKLKGILICKTHDQFTIISLKVRDEVFQPINQ